MLKLRLEITAHARAAARTVALLETVNEFIAHQRKFLRTTIGQIGGSNTKSSKDAFATRVGKAMKTEQPYLILSVPAVGSSPSDVSRLMADYVDALQVGFITHTSLEWQKYWVEKRAELGRKVTFLHPDYRDDMPDWIHPPKPEKP